MSESQSPILDAWDRAVGIGWGTQVYSGATGLPRSFDTFREGQFSPFEPIWPVPIDRGEEPSGRPRPRRWQFPVGWNLPIGQPGTEGIKLASFQVLRDYAEVPTIPRNLIELAKADIEDLSWDVIPTPSAQFAMQGNAKKRADWESRKDEVMQFFEDPDPDNYDGFDEWLNALLEDMLVLDAVALFRHPTLGSRIIGKGNGPCGSDLGALEILDGCYAADTEVLTRRGWVAFQDVDVVTDEFATRDPKTELFEWQPATARQVVPYQGEMYRFRSRTLDLLVTPNHRMLMRNPKTGREQIMRADEFPYWGAIPAQSRWEAPDRQVVVFGSDPLAERCVVCGEPDVVALDRCNTCWRYRNRHDGADRPSGLVAAARLRHGARIARERPAKRAPGAAGRQLVFSGDDFAAFMGMWLAEGCVTKTGGRDAIYITQKETSKGFGPFRELLTRVLGHEPIYDGHSWYFKCAALSVYLRQFGHAHEKFVPDDIKEMSVRQLAIFWEFFRLGDGHTEASGRQTLTTVSRRMAGDLQEIAQKIGLSASVRVDYPTGDSVMADGRVIRKENKRPRYAVRLRSSVAQKPQITVEQYDGMVYCVSVPNGTLYVRRNGQPAWCGNSTIRPLLDDWGGRPRPPEPAYQQIVWGVPRVDLMDIINLGPNATITDLKAINPVLEELSTRGDEWSADQLLYMRQNPRSWTPYGFGPLEQAMLPASILLARQTWQFEFFRAGSLPQVFLDPGETIANAEEARQLQTAINMLGGDLAGKHQVIVVPPGSRVMPQKDADLSGQIDEWLAALLCMPFGYAISDLGLTPKISSLQSPAASMGAAQTATDRGTQHAILPRVKKLKRKVFDRVIQKLMGQEDMEWSWGVVERGETKDQLAQRNLELFKGSISTLDEARIAQEMEPLGLKGISDVPLVWSNAGAAPITSILDVQQANLEQTQAQTQQLLSPPAPAALPPGKTKTKTASASTPRGPRTKTAPPKKQVARPIPAKKLPAKKPVERGNSTPLEAGAQAAENTTNRNPQARTRKVLESELAVLRRYLRNGNRIEKFQSKVLRPSALRAAYGHAGDCHQIVKMAQLRQDRRDDDLLGDQADLMDSFATTIEKCATGLPITTGVQKLCKALSRSMLRAYAAGELAALADLDAGPGDFQVHEGELAIHQKVAEQESRLQEFLLVTDGPAVLAQRVAAWAESLTAPYEAGYVAKSRAIAQERGEQYGFQWHLGESEECLQCVARDGKVFGPDELPGFPGEQNVCLAGERCGCWYSVVKDFGLSSPLASGMVPFTLEPGVRALYPEPEDEEPQGEPWAVKGSAAEAAEPHVVAAGIAVRAEDTGRVLMLQRALDDTDSGPGSAAGTWEFPGGHIEEGETPFGGAAREWQEEVGTSLPSGQIVGMWESPNGIYQGFVYSVPAEEDVRINLDYPRVENPDAPLHAKPETAAWFDIQDLPGMPALRLELRQDLATVLHELRQPRRIDKYRADQPRDDHGRFASGAGGSSNKKPAAKKPAAKKPAGGSTRPASGTPAVPDYLSHADRTRGATMGVVADSVAQLKKYIDDSGEALKREVLGTTRSERTVHVDRHEKVKLAIRIGAIALGVAFGLATAGVSAPVIGGLAIAMAPKLFEDFGEFLHHLHTRHQEHVHKIMKALGNTQVIDLFADAFTQQGLDADTARYFASCMAGMADPATPAFAALNITTEQLDSILGNVEGLDAE